MLSTGTYLDSLRFRVHLAETLTVDPVSVEAQVLGEHGTSEVFVWSGARVAGVPVMDVFAQRSLSAEETRRAVEVERERERDDEDWYQARVSDLSEYSENLQSLIERMAKGSN